MFVEWCCCLNKAQFSHDCLAEAAPTSCLYRDVWIAAIAWSRTSLETQTPVMCVCLQRRRVRHECKLRSLHAHGRLSALLHTFIEYSLTLDCNGVFAIKAFIAIAPLYIDHNVTATSASLRAPQEDPAWCRLCFGSILKQTEMQRFFG